MSQNRFSLKLIAGITVALFVGVALYLRIAFSYDQVFSGDWIKFASHDAYHYMRLVDNLVHNFPHLINFDPYMRYPQGLQLGSLNLFVYLLSGIIWLVGLGSPTQHTVDIVGVYFPAIVGALTVIPVYFIGKTLFNRWAGVLSAGLVAILSGEFLGRTKLGFTDRDAVEVLLTALTMLFLILAIKSACQKQLTFNHLKRRDWPVVTKPLIYSLLAGVFLGIYLLTWKGAFLFVIIIFVYFIIQYIIDHFGHKSTDYLCFVGTITFSIALIIFWTASPSQVYLAPLVIGLLTPLVLTGVSWLMVKRRIKPAYYPLTMIGLSMVGLVILHIINPSLLSTILGSLGRIFAQPATELTILESQPILFHGGKFSFLPIWGNFTTGFFLSFISLGILIYLTIKRGEADKTLFIVWSLVILVFTLAMRRFALLFVVNVALLAGYLSILVYYVIRFIIGYLSGNSTDYMSGRFLELAGFKTLAAKPVEVLRKWGYYDVLGVPRNATDKQIKRAFRELTFKYRPGRDRADIAEERFKEINKAYEVLSDRHKRAAYDRSEYGMAKREKGKARRKRGGFNITTNHINMALAVIAVFFLAFFPNIGPAVVTASQARFAPSDSWVESLSWLKDNTPDPFGDPDFYYDLYETPFHYPETAYGVVAWWDYGYWIVRIGHRLPNCDPGGGARGRVGRFFTAQDEALASQMIDKLNSRYIIIDRATVTSKFHAVATYAGSSEEEFPDIYYQAQKGMMVPVPLLYPEYYRSLAVRLYNFDGGEVTPQSSTVISYKEKVRWDGMPYKEIVNEKSFSSYEEAEAYVLSQKSENYKIVSNNPFISPVPLKALEHYKLIYSSDSCIMQPGVGMIPEVKIFEYTQ